MSTAGDLARAVGSALGADVLDAAQVHGGDVAQSFRLDLADGRRVFAKTHPGAPEGFFTTEAAGLGGLRDTGTVAVPEVLAVSDGGCGAGRPNMLVLEWIEEGPPGQVAEAHLGRELAAMHDTIQPGFGRPDRRSTGSRGLPNEPCATWADFYSGQRLLPLARMARDSEVLPPRVIRDLESVAARLEELGGPPEPPSLLHGDLWAGNRLVDTSGRNWLIDPAAHGGHREFDLAMMRLFGGFGSQCFEAYQESSPLADGWQARVALHQIAPLVVHAIKFGGSYVAAATAAITRYC